MGWQSPAVVKNEALQETVVMPACLPIVHSTFTKHSMRTEQCCHCRRTNHNARNTRNTTASWGSLLSKSGGQLVVRLSHTKSQSDSQSVSHTFEAS